MASLKKFGFTAAAVLIFIVGVANAVGKAVDKCHFAFLDHELDQWYCYHVKNTTTLPMTSMDYKGKWDAATSQCAMTIFYYMDRRLAMALWSLNGRKELQHVAKHLEAMAAEIGSLGFNVSSRVLLGLSDRGWLDASDLTFAKAFLRTYNMGFRNLSGGVSTYVSLPDQGFVFKKNDSEAQFMHDSNSFIVCKARANIEDLDFEDLGEQFQKMLLDSDVHIDELDPRWTRKRRKSSPAVHAFWGLLLVTLFTYAGF